MRPALRVYLAATIAFGGLVLVREAAVLASTPHLLEWAMLTGLALLIGTRMVPIASVEASISVADAFYIASALLFGPGPAAIALAVDGAIASWRKRYDFGRLAFNGVAPAFSMWAAAHVFLALGGRPLSVDAVPFAGVLFPLLCLTAVYYLLNSGLMAIAIGLQLSQSPLRIWRTHFLWLATSYLASASVALCLVLIVQQVGALAVAILLPVVAVFHRTLSASYGRLEDTTRHLAQVDRLYQSTVETLAMAIDAKDDVTHSHVRRVQTYATALARALGVSDDTTIKAIEAAALLHDTGKLAVPERILNKPGRLTHDEFEQMKEHVEVGANILALVDFPYPVVPIVRGHHENWDGSGYPRGVTGEDIPIGARILSVVDCFDALTSDRPYRARLSDEDAIAILLERRGRMYDPAVVDTFIRIQKQIALPTETSPDHQQVFGRIAASRHAPAAPEPETSPAPRQQESELLSFVSLARLASGAISRPDVLALASHLVQAATPAATGAWFVAATDGRLVAADAFGPHADAIRGTTIDVGNRLTGWVAANRQVIVNSDPVLDLGARARRLGLASCLSVPLTSGDALAGVLTLYSPEGSAFTDDHGRRLQMIAPHVSDAILAAAASPVAVQAPRDLRLVASRPSH